MTSKSILQINANVQEVCPWESGELGRSSGSLSLTITMVE